MSRLRHANENERTDEKIVPFSQFLTKTSNSNSHFSAFFMLYTNQLTKKKILLFLAIPDHIPVGPLGCRESQSKISIYSFL
jgi:hypothetical protein